MVYLMRIKNLFIEVMKSIKKYKVYLGLKKTQQNFMKIFYFH